MTFKPGLCSKKAQNDIEDIFGYFFNHNEEVLDLIKIIAGGIENMFEDLVGYYEQESLVSYSANYSKSCIVYRGVNYCNDSILTKREFQIVFDEKFHILGICQYIVDKQNHTLDIFRDVYNYHMSNNNSYSINIRNTVIDGVEEFNKKLNIVAKGTQITLDKQVYGENYCCYRSLNYEEIFNTQGRILGETFDVQSSAMGMFRSLAIAAEEDIRKKRIPIIDETKKWKYPNPINCYGEKILFQGHDGNIVYGVVQESNGRAVYKKIVPTGRRHGYEDAAKRGNLLWAYDDDKYRSRNYDNNYGSRDSDDNDGFYRNRECDDVYDYDEYRHLRNGVSMGPDGNYYDDDGNYVPDDCAYEDV